MFWSSELERQEGLQPFISLPQAIVLLWSTKTQTSG
jgi:hypothetical protein